MSFPRMGLRLSVDNADDVNIAQELVTASSRSFQEGEDGDQVDLDREPTSKHSSAPRSLFVRSLPPSATSESLTDYFSQSYPLKHATVVSDPVTKTSKGYGFVTFVDPEDATKARDELDGSIFDGRKIKVDIAKPRHREVGDTGLDGPRKSRPTAEALQAKAEREKKRLVDTRPPKLIIRNLPWSIKKPDQLALLFRSYGKVKTATLPPSKAGLSPGFGFVVLRGRKNAEKALAGVNGKIVDGRTLAVDWAVDKDIWRDMQGNDQTENESLKSEDDDGGVALDDIPQSDAEHDHDSTNDEEDDMEIDVAEDREDLDDEDEFETDEDEEMEDDEGTRPADQDNSTTLFVRNLPFSVSDQILSEHFKQFGAIRYARVVMDPVTERSKGTAFVCFFNKEDAINCLRQSPKDPTGSSTDKNRKSHAKPSLLNDLQSDPHGHFTIDGRVLHVSRAVDRNEAQRLTIEGSSYREARDKDRRRLYLLSEGTVATTSPLYNMLGPSERKMREDSAKQRQMLIKSNPSLHLSLTRLSVRNIPRYITSKDLKALAREAVVGFSKDVKAGIRAKLSAEELSRGGEDMKEADRLRKLKGKGIVKQAKIVFEGREGTKISESSEAGRSRGYGFIEYTTHRSALMGLRWLNGHLVERRTVPTESPANGVPDKPKRLIVEFAIENAQVVARRKENEQKARERSQAVVANAKLSDASVSKPELGKKTFSKDQLMKKTRLGIKRKRDREVDSVVAQPFETGEEAQLLNSKKLQKAARRQQIIGRKRHLRKYRKTVSA